MAATTFTEAQVRRAVKGVLDAGLPVAMIEFHQDGTIRFELDKFKKVEPVNPYDLLDYRIPPRERPVFLPSTKHYIPVKTRAAVYDRDGEVCAYCKTKTGPFQIDHIMPKSRGGLNTIDNLTVACADCNRSKSYKTVEEWKGCK